ncbi:hypothetical protein NPN26_24825, partial [Vibrio parahaemolyticus]|nr:hypothetical protein [Vibrio parahaemolyticus]
STCGTVCPATPHRMRMPAGMTAAGRLSTVWSTAARYGCAAPDSGGVSPLPDNSRFYSTPSCRSKASRMRRPLRRRRHPLLFVLRA